MFEHLPLITDDSFQVMIDGELPYFAELVEGCAREAETADEVIDCACAEFKESNPNLAAAVRGAAYAVAGELEGKVESGVEWQAGLAAVPGLLATLRLIDRELEARELEKKLSL